MRATNSWAAIQNPVCTWLDPEHLDASCTGTLDPSGRTVTETFSCNGTVGNPDLQPIPKVIPNPAPEVKVDFPTCPQGSYAYTDLDDLTTCSISTKQDADPPLCASGNAGVINGELVCLPANPAPDSAASAAAAAKLKAAIAKQFPDTPQAVQAAKEASIEAQKAKDAANSLPSSAPTQASAQEAINAAKQAAAYSGTGYNGPKQVNTPTGTGGGGTSPVNTGPKECGSPGKPKCQIDETGTPTNGNEAFSTASTALDAAVTAHNDALAGVVSEEGKDASWGWFPALPEGECTPLEMGSLPPVNWCFIVPQLQTIVSWCWALIAVFLILGMTQKAIRGN